MLPKTQLQQVIPQRIIELASRMEAAIWSPVAVPLTVEATAPRDAFCNLDAARKAKRSPVTQFPHVWGRLWQQRWFRLQLPANVDRAGLYLQWRDQGEATLYADGVPWYGFDPAHLYAPLPTDTRDLWIESTCARTGIWVPNAGTISPEGSVMLAPQCARRNDAAWAAYWDIRVLLDLLELEYQTHLPTANDWGRGPGYHSPVFSISPLFRKLLRRLDAFADAYDHEGLVAAPLLRAIYRDLPAASASLRAVLTGHAHIDLVWLWPERIGESKAVHTFAIANRLMDLYPEFVFGYSQPCSYEAVERRSPLLMNAVRQRIREGRWEATGAMYVESDTQLPCGEALARSIVLGQERFSTLRDGQPSRVLWLPDVFGYSPCLPQILRQCGVPWFFTTKLTWGTIHRFPYSSFCWQGHDGSEIVAHVSQEVGYNGTVSLPELRRHELAQQEAGIHDEFLVPTGWGDGGGGVTPEMLERARRTANLCGVAQCGWGGIEDFFSRLQSLASQLPVWRGELYLEYHRGVQTTHGDLKQAFRAAERALQTLEAAHAVGGKGPVDSALWQRLVFSQFHDAIPGSSIREVYEELVPELLAITAAGPQLAAKALAAKRGSQCLFNPLAVPLRITLPDQGTVADLPPLAGLPRGSVCGRQPAAPVLTTSHSLSNGRVVCSLNDAGEIAEFALDGQPLLLAAPANQLWLYPDHPKDFAAWDIDRGTLGNGKRITGAAGFSIVEDTPLRGVIACQRQLTAASTVVVRYILEAESPVLRIEWDIDWQDRACLLKAVFPTAYCGRMARFAAPFGSTLRPQQPGDQRVEAMYEVPASRWVTVCDDGEQQGLGLLMESKFGYTAWQGSVGVSLVRSAILQAADTHLPLRTLANREPYSDIGRHCVRGALTRFRADAPRHEMPAPLADSLFCQPVSYVGQPLVSPLLALDGDNALHIAWVKPLADGSMVLRCNETMGRRGRVSPVLAAGYSASIVDLCDQPLEAPSLAADGSIAFTPYCLFGIRIVRD
jgi:alpha-mannosidase